MVLVSPWGFCSQKVVLLEFFVYIARDVSAIELLYYTPMPALIILGDIYYGVFRYWWLDIQSNTQISGAFFVCHIIPLGLFLPGSDFLLYAMSLVMIYTLIRLLF